MRSFLSSSFIFGAILIAKVQASPAYTNKFSVPLPIPPVLTPLTTYTPSSSGSNPIDFYQITVQQFNKQIWDGKPSTSLVGYNGMYPGPTIKASRGREIVLRVVNQGDANSALHLHGSATVAPFDGWAEDMIAVGEYKDYYYPNFQNGRTLWYHDHAHMVTASNVQKGQAGFYILEDPAGEAGLNLPSGDFDIPLLISSKNYDATTGAVLPPSTAGDTIEVNGQLYPYLEVEPRQYRFRILDGAATRTFTLGMYEGNSTTGPLGFQVIASDAGLMASPVSATSLKMAMGERYEIVIDFTGLEGNTYKLRNTESLTSDTLGQILQFRVKNVTPTPGGGTIPSTLRTIDFLPQPTTPVKQFTFAITNGQFTINGKTFSDVNNRVLANVPRGTTEIWELINGGGGTHPVHIHLIDFQIISRSGGTGGTTIPAHEAAALKDIVILNPNETVRLLAKYSPWDGLYMFHCHNLVHEDNEMMAAFNVTALPDFGYPETTRFLDPMDPAYAAQPFTSTDLTLVQSTTLPGFSALNAYNHIPEIMEALDTYHGTR
ncbi:oxidase cueO precursor [Peziza echinospora]|nr:oxidase cueO precursor [Peziza echinospora]